MARYALAMSIRKLSPGLMILLPIVAAVLAGCSSDLADGAQTPVPTVTVTTTATATATPAAQARTSDDKLTELDAWNACSSAAQAGYVLKYPGSRVIAYDTSRAPQRNDDGSFAVNVGITPAKGSGVNGGIVGICTVKGTIGSPQIVSLMFKDI
jgi:hypothetical protein